MRKTSQILKIKNIYKKKRFPHILSLPGSMQQKSREFCTLLQFRVPSNGLCVSKNMSNMLIPPMYLFSEDLDGFETQQSLT
jgi:hypothetical protein